MMNIDPKLSDEETRELIMKPYNDMVAKVDMLNVEPPYLAEYTSQLKCCIITRIVTKDDIIISSKYKRIYFESHILRDIVNGSNKIIINGDTKILNSPYVIIRIILKKKLVIISDEAFNYIVAEAVKRKEADGLKLLSNAINLCYAVYNRYNIEELLNIHSELIDINERMQRDIGYNSGLLVKNIKMMFNEFHKLGIEVE